MSWGGVHNIVRKIYLIKLYRLGVKLGFDIPLNVLDAGVCIHHYGSIIINKEASIGKNVVLQQGVVIGAAGFGSSASPTIGNNVEIGAGAKIIGDVHIPNNAIIGANAVVTHSFDEDGIILAGIPARRIGNIKEKQPKHSNISQEL